MPDSSAQPAGSPPRSDPSLRLLEQIAASIGCSAGALLTGEGLPAEPAQTHEMLCLWARLRSDAERERALRFVRDVAASAGP